MFVYGIHLYICFGCFFALITISISSKDLYQFYLKTKNFCKDLWINSSRIYLIKFEEENDEIFFVIKDQKIKTNLKTSAFGDGLLIGKKYFKPLDKKVEYDAEDF